MKIGIIYRDLFQNPHTPVVYRKLYDYYTYNNMEPEANAFAELLRFKFNEIVLDEKKSDNDSDNS